VANVYLRRFSGSAWQEVNAGAITSATGTGGFAFGDQRE